MATSIQTFAGNVGIGTNDPKAYVLNVADGGTTRITTLSATSIQIGNVTNAFIPSGSIAMWGNDAIPTGWVLCDGNNGTPNLNDRFIMGAGGAYAVDTRGGTNSTTTLTNSKVPQHRHTGTTGNQSANHTHNFTDPGHYHRQKATDDALYNEWTAAQSQFYYGQWGFNTYNTNHNLSLGNQSANHTHELTLNSVGSGTAVATWPLWRAVRFIMKT